jgi:hypothetical protein
MENEKAAALLWDEWKYRHDLFWRSLYRYAGSVITLWIIPFLKPEVFKPFPAATLLFPVLALFLSVFSAWLLGAEQRRFAMVNAKYDELRQEFLPPRMPKEGLVDKLFAARVGAYVVLFYVLSLAIGSIVDGILVWKSLHP